MVHVNYDKISQGAAEVGDDDLREFLTDRYGLSVLSLSRLGGEIDQNVRVDCADGSSYVVKVSGDLADRAHLEWQVSVLRHLAVAAPEIPVSRLVAGRDGGDLQVIERGPRRNLVRVLTWLPGRMLVELTRYSPRLLTDLGALAGTLSLALDTVTRDPVPASHYWDLLRSPAAVESCLSYLTDKSQQALIMRSMQRFSAIEPALPYLPVGVVHQDLNDFNVLAAEGPSRENYLSGVLDVGDALRTARVAELAVVVAYAMLRSPDPLRTAVQVTQGFHAVRPLSEAELSVVFPLAVARLCVNVSTWTRRRALREEAYANARMRNTWPTLQRLDQVSSTLAEAALRAACGLVPSPAGERIEGWLASHQPTGSVPQLGSGHLRPDTDTDTDTVPPVATAALEPATLVLGRGINPAEANSLVITPLAAAVHDVDADGGRVILRHHTGSDDCWTVWTGIAATVRYGEELSAGQSLGSGIAGVPVRVRLLPAEDLLAVDGLIQPWLRPTWASLSPDPALLWGETSRAQKEQSGVLEGADVVRLRDRYLGRSQRYYYQHPMNLVSSQGVWLVDENGLGYLDAINNVTHIGHANAHVADAVSRQVRRLNTNSRFVYAELASYAERLANLLPDPLEVVYFACTGSEANDLALRIVRQVTGRQDVLVLDGAYHGNTTAVTGISPDRYDAPGGSGAPSTTHAVLQPNRYRGPYGYDDPNAAARYAADVARVVGELVAGDRPPAAFFSESLMGTAGQVVLPPTYLAAAFDSVRAAGGLCVSDEVQIGFGRLGDEFWGFQTHGVVPDVVTMGKPMGNGMPISAVVTTRAIADEFDKGLKYFNTFGGNPVSCAAGMAVLDVVEGERLQERAATVGRYLLTQLEELKQRHPLIGDVRGQGLYAGIELVTDRNSKDPAAAAASRVSERMKEEGVIIYPNGRLGNILKLKPPMIFGSEHVDLLVDRLERVLSEDW